MKQVVLNTIHDVVIDFIAYDRKYDEDLPAGIIEELLARGEITIEEMVAEFDKQLREQLK